MDDWASDGEAEDLGDLGKLDLPEVKITAPPVPTPPPAPVVPATNAWQRRDPGDVRAVMRGPVGASAASGGQRSAPPGGPPRRAGFGRDPPAGRPAYGSGGFGSGGSGGSGNGGYGFNSGSGPAGGAGNGGYGFNSGGGPAPAGSGDAPTAGGTGATLYVSNLPPRVEAQELIDFFQDAGCVDVRLSHHTDTGNVKAAFVVLGPNVDPEQALSYEGRMFGSRTIHVKVDGERRSGSTRERQPYGSGGFGVNGSRDRDRGRSNGGVGGGFGGSGGGFGGSGGFGGGGGGGGSGHWGGSSYELPSRGSERERNSSLQAPDPTIPTGPAPAGRKRLVLKPRTKPMPKLDIDHRAIGGPTNRTRSSGMGRSGGDWGPGGSVDNGRLAGLRGAPSSNDAPQMPRSAPPPSNSAKKDMDKVTAKMASTKIADPRAEEKPKPTLKNSFALLGEGDE